METKQKIRENGNKDFIYTCGYESRLKKEKMKGCKFHCCLSWATIGSKGYAHIFASTEKERTRTEILNSIDDPYPFKTWLNDRFF